MRPTCLSIFLVVFALALATALPVQALSGGINDGDTAVSNSTVWVSGCSGTLIAPTLVLTAAHCGNYVPPPGMPLVDGTFVPQGEWRALPSAITVRVGADPSTPAPDRNFTATYFNQAGWADIIVLKLDRAVPVSLALPVRPLTRLSAAQREPGFWARQLFIVSGYGGGGPRRQLALRRNGAYPCKNLPDLEANDEFICTLVNGTSSLEPGDSGGPLYWSDGSVRYVIGAYQGNAQAMRVCTGGLDGTVPTDACASFEYRQVRPDASGCQQQTETVVRRAAWHPEHHTATFFDRGRCWILLDGVKYHQPNIGVWLERLLLSEPAGDTPILPIVLQTEGDAPTRFRLELYAGSGVSRTRLSAAIYNSHAPTRWPRRQLTMLWGWQVAGSPGEIVYTARFPGHAFTRPVYRGRTLEKPFLIGGLLPLRAGGPPARMVEMAIYFHRTTGELLTTWEIDRLFPGRTERAPWKYLESFGYMPAR